MNIVNSICGRKLLMGLLIWFGVLSASAQPIVIADISDDRDTAADELLLAAAEMGRIRLAGFVVTHTDEAVQREVMQRLNNLVATSRLTGCWVMAGASEPLSLLRRALPDGRIAWKPVRASAAVIKAAGRLSPDRDERIHYLAGAQLSTLAHALLQNPVLIPRFHITGPFGVREPSGDVLTDRSAWITLVSSGMEFSSWQSPGQPIAFHPGQLSRSPFADEWLLKRLWTRSAGDGFVDAPSESTDPLLVAAAMIVFPELYRIDERFSVSLNRPVPDPPVTNNNKDSNSSDDDSTDSNGEDPGGSGKSDSAPDSVSSAEKADAGQTKGNNDRNDQGSRTAVRQDADPRLSLDDLEWTASSEGKFRVVRFPDPLRTGTEVGSLFRQWGALRFRSMPRQVFIDGDFANGITDLAIVMRALYASGINTLGFGVSSFPTQGLNFLETVQTGNSCLSMMLLNEVQLERNMFMGSPPMRFAPARGDSPYYSARDTIVLAARSVPPGRRLHVIASGPMTNIALALRADPSIAPRLHVWLTGARPGNESGEGWVAGSPHYSTDPQAFSIVMNFPGLTRTVIPDNIEDPWILERRDYFTAIQGAVDGGWRFIGNYWDDFLNVRPGNAIGLTRDRAFFNETALIEILIAPEAATYRPAGFGDGSFRKSGGTYWVEKLDIDQLKRSFLQSAARR